MADSFASRDRFYPKLCLFLENFRFEHVGLSSWPTAGFLRHLTICRMPVSASARSERLVHVRLDTKQGRNQVSIFAKQSGRTDCGLRQYAIACLSGPQYLAPSAPHSTERPSNPLVSHTLASVTSVSDPAALPPQANSVPPHFMPTHASFAAMQYGNGTSFLLSMLGRWSVVVLWNPPYHLNLAPSSSSRARTGGLGPWPKETNALPWVLGCGVSGGVALGTPCLTSFAARCSQPRQQRGFEPACEDDMSHVRLRQSRSDC